MNRKQCLIVLVILLLLPVATTYAVIEDSNTGVATASITINKIHPYLGDSTFSFSSVAVSFVATTNGFINGSSFYMAKYGSPTGNGYAVLYTEAGGEPDVELARSDAFDVSGLGTIPTAGWFNFTFASYKLALGTTYMIAFENPSTGTIDSSNYIRLYTIADVTAVSAHYHEGSWSNAGSNDPMFIVESTPITVADVTATPEFLNAELNWVNVTVGASNGVADIKTVDIQVNTTGDAETGTLRWTQATNVFSEVSDPDTIFALGTGVRTNINATYDLISFEFSLTNGTTGLCDVYATVVNDADITESGLYEDLFVLVSVDWSGIVYGLIDEVFALFGIPNFITSLTTLITSFSSQFAASMVRLAQLVYQQFRIIGAVFNFFIYWFTAMTDIILQFSLFYQSILNNTATWGNGIGNLWLFLNYDSWAPILPLVIFIWWFDSVEKRGTQTVGGMLQVLINDANTVISITSYFVGMFSLIINTIIDRVYGLFDAMP